MTAPSNPTPATIDAAAAADLVLRDGTALSEAVDRGELEEGDVLAVIGLAWPILAAAHADQLAQAHAAGTAEGAVAEREHIVGNLRTRVAMLLIAAEDCWKATVRGGSAEYIATWDRQRVRSLAAAEALEEHADAIARAGTSGDAS